MRKLMTLLVVMAGASVGAWSAIDDELFITTFCAVLWGVAAWLATKVFDILADGAVSRDPSEPDALPDLPRPADARGATPRSSPSLSRSLLSEDDLPLTLKRILHRDGW